jgi:WD40 repeat protein
MLPGRTQGTITAARFSPDGGRLALTQDDGITLLWDLTRLRAELAEMGLDWQ